MLRRIVRDKTPHSVSAMSAVLVPDAFFPRSRRSAVGGAVGGVLEHVTQGSSARQPRRKPGMGTVNTGNSYLRPARDLSEDSRGRPVFVLEFERECQSGLPSVVGWGRTALSSDPQLGDEP
jgi:hypothetical protein